MNTNIEDSKNTQKHENTCFSCGKPIPPDESFCEDCKAKMADINTGTSQQPKKEDDLTNPYPEVNADLFNEEDDANPGIKNANIIKKNAVLLLCAVGALALIKVGAMAIDKLQGTPRQQMVKIHREFLTDFFKNQTKKSKELSFDTNLSLKLDDEEFNDFLKIKSDGKSGIIQLNDESDKLSDFNTTFTQDENSIGCYFKSDDTYYVYDYTDEMKDIQKKKLNSDDVKTILRVANETFETLCTDDNVTREKQTYAYDYLGGNDTGYVYTFAPTYGDAANATTKLANRFTSDEEFRSAMKGVSCDLIKDQALKSAATSLKNAAEEYAKTPNVSLDFVYKVYTKKGKLTRIEFIESHTRRTFSYDEDDATHQDETVDTATIGFERSISKDVNKQVIFNYRNDNQDKMSLTREDNNDEKMNFGELTYSSQSVFGDETFHSITKAEQTFDKNNVSELNIPLGTIKLSSNDKDVLDDDSLTAEVIIKRNDDGSSSHILQADDKSFSIEATHGSDVQRPNKEPIKINDLTDEEKEKVMHELKEKHNIYQNF